MKFTLVLVLFVCLLAKAHALGLQCLIFANFKPEEKAQNWVLRCVPACPVPISKPAQALQDSITPEQLLASEEDKKLAELKKLLNPETLNDIAESPQSLASLADIPVIDTEVDLEMPDKETQTDAEAAFNETAP